MPLKISIKIEESTFVSPTLPKYSIVAFHHFPSLAMYFNLPNLHSYWTSNARAPQCSSRSQQKSTKMKILTTPPNLPTASKMCIKNKITDWGGSKCEAVNNLGDHGKIVVTLILLMFNIKMNHKMYFLVKLKKRDSCFFKRRSLACV